MTVVNIDYTIPIWVQRDIYAEELNGEIINDAVFNPELHCSGAL